MPHRGIEQVLCQRFYDLVFIVNTSTYAHSWESQEPPPRLAVDKLTLPPPAREENVAFSAGGRAGGIPLLPNIDALARRQVHPVAFLDAERRIKAFLIHHRCGAAHRRG